MIFTFTPNPSVDYIMGVNNYKEGVVNRTSYENIFAGGKGINVSLVLKELNVPSVALGFIGGFTGDIIESLLTKANVDTAFIRLNDGVSRINVKIKADTETEINAQGPVIDSCCIDALYQKLATLNDGDTLILAGSAPKGSGDDFYSNIMSFLSDKNTNVAVDTTGALLLNTLKHKPFLIKPNNYELEEIAGKPLSTDDDIISACKELQNQGARNILVSLGGDGALLVSEFGDILKQSAPDGRVVNTTGAGDSMVAGFIAGYLDANDYLHALKLGISAGSATAFSDTLATSSEIERLYHSLDL